MIPGRWTEGYVGPTLDRVGPSYSANDLPRTGALDPLERDGSLQRSDVPGRPANVWTYLNTDGEPVGQVRRVDLPRAKVLPYTPDGRGGWRLGAMPAPRPLYRLPTILAASPNIPVLVVEGEKCADAAHAMIPGALGAIATTWAGGSNAVHKSDWSPLAGRIVCIWPDADDAGDRAAQDVIRACVDAGARAIWCLAVPDTWPKGHDVADLEQAEVEDIWTSGNLWVGGEVDPAKARVKLATAKAEPALRRELIVRDRHRDLRSALDVDRAREQNILDVAHQLGIQHNKGWALCPFHDDSSPSLHLNARKNAAFCNPCGRSWNSIDLVMELRGLDFVGAVRWLNNEPEPLRRTA